MHNLISRNQLAEWKYIEENYNRCKEELELVNDYFDCLIECDEDQSTCKHICRIILDEGGRIPPFFCAIILTVNTFIWTRKD